MSGKGTKTKTTNSTAPENKLLKYKKYSDVEHVLKKPDTYMGSIEQLDNVDYIYDDENNKIIQKQFTYIPGLYKILDEAIVNCRDHKIRQDSAIQHGVENALPVKNIEFGYNEENGMFWFKNDGNGIDVAKHPEYDFWIPEMIFAHLRTSTNYDENKKETKVGGKNGYGIKIAFIWSKYARIETVDHVRGLKYKQEFKDNLSVIEKPKVTKVKSKKPYTLIEFIPDYEKMHISKPDTDFIQMFKKRCYDIGGVTESDVKVKLNNQPIGVKNFQQYIDLYIGAKSETSRVYESANDDWEYAVCLSPNDEFQQVSFVNGIYTSKGGKHVDYIVNQVLRKITSKIKEKKKVDVKSSSIKEQLMVFVRCNIDNPSFSSQTKEEMTSPQSKFGSSCSVSDKFVDTIMKSSGNGLGVMNTALALNQVKEKANSKKTDGTKCRTLRGLSKLIDANYAGTSKSHLCMLILCEGDSAKSGIVSGLTKEDRNYVGVYPMKGKIFNVRGEKQSRINENKEITEIKQILGLQSNKNYQTQDDVVKYLRYGKVIYMTDQDLDGLHIRGLGLNLFQSEWNSLTKIPNFIGYMNTPIIKARKGSQEQIFYNEGEYEVWKENCNNFKSWNIKYYKGLGTSTSKEFKEYFKNKKVVYFQYSGNDCDNTIDMAFNKNRSDDRKEWLNTIDTSNKEYYDVNDDKITYTNFINKEFIYFSIYDNQRSIPNLVDGLKTSLRKVLYSAFKRKLTNEIKVAQFSGYVSEHSGYHHGEASLNAAIVGMAQNYVGSKNVNLFVPNGQFGTRYNGGKDAASERYIYTYLNPMTRAIYPEQDDYILNYLDDDGYKIEPKFYLPIIPMILVNGAQGIGTGYSCNIPCYNPQDLVIYLKNKLNNMERKDNIPIHPYYQGFKGDVILEESTTSKYNKYLVKGKYRRLGNDKVQVTELPIGYWTEDFKQHLEFLISGEQTKSKSKTTKSKKADKTLKDYKDMSTDVVVDFTLTFHSGVLDTLINNTSKTKSNVNQLEELLKLFVYKNTSNMYLFDEEDHLYQYDNVYDIIDKFYTVRYNGYVERKQFLLDILEKEANMLSNKAKYIQDTLDNKIDLRSKKRNMIVSMLQDMGFDKDSKNDNYDYLIKMPMDSVCVENVEKLMKQHQDKCHELDVLKKKTIEDMWNEELDNLATKISETYSTE